MRIRDGRIVPTFCLLWVTAATLLARQPAGTPNAITGRVTDASGAPVAGALVTLVDRDERDGRTRFHPANAQARFATDKDGRYRMDAVPVGDHYVVAIPNNVGIGPDRQPSRSGYRTTFHPSAATAAEAMPVRVNVREPQTADITLLPARLAVISGTVLTSSGAPAKDGKLRVALGDGLFGVAGFAVDLNPAGKFAIAGVAPGTYHLHYSEGAWPPPRDVPVPLISGATVIVRDGDALNISVLPIRMVRATGRVFLDPSLRDQFRPAGFTVAATPLDFDGNPGPTRPGTIRDDLTFEFRVWPRAARVRVLPEDTGWVVKSVRLGGADVTRTGIDFRGDEVIGIEIELTRRF